LPVRRRVAAVATAAGLAAATPIAYVLAERAIAPKPVQIQDACHPHRASPGTGGVQGFLQDQVLTLLDRTACRFGSSREQLVLALADKDEAKRFKAEHGHDPRTVGGLLGALIGG
jgi:hypothetical protein